MGFLPAADAMALMPNILSCLQLDISNLICSFWRFLQLLQLLAGDHLVYWNEQRLLSEVQGFNWQTSQLNLTLQYQFIRNHQHADASFQIRFLNGFVAEKTQGINKTATPFEKPCAEKPCPARRRCKDVATTRPLQLYELMWEFVVKTNPSKEPPTLIS